MPITTVTTTPLKIEDWGLTEYQPAFDRQVAMVQQQLGGQGQDTLVLVEHPATVTLGRRATAADLHSSSSSYQERGITLQKINRGGLATAHEAGQLVVYPVIRLKKKDLRWYADQFLKVVVSLLAEYGVEGYLKDGEPGVWVDGRKICSFGIALKKWVSCHGIALNINNNLEVFTTIVPCGRPAEEVTSLSLELGCQIDMDAIKSSFVTLFCSYFDYHDSQFDLCKPLI